MSVDGVRRTMERVELGSAEPTEDEEGMSALRSADLRLETDAAATDEEECMGEEDDGDEGVSDDDGVGEDNLIDDDDEGEEEEEYVELLAEMQRAPSGGGESETETKAKEAGSSGGKGKAQKENYALLTAAIFDRLPVEKYVFQRVTEEVAKTCSDNKDFLAPLATKLLGMAMVRRFVWNWWGFLKQTLIENSEKPPNSFRAALYTKIRRDTREEAIANFISDVDIRRQASDIPEGRVNRDLTLVFLAIEFVP